MIIITLTMIIIIKTTTIVISHYLKRNTNNVAKLHVIYVNGNLYKFIFLVQTIRSQLLSSSEILHERKSRKL